MNIDQEDYHYRLKIVVLGETKSGKTTLLDSINIIILANQNIKKNINNL